MNAQQKTFASSIPENARGSEWRRWDLHVHTASSYDYKYKEADADDKLAKALKEQNIAAIAITDHFIIDPQRIKSIREKVPEITVFPGVELRTDKGAPNIHVILIFSETIDVDTLSSDFSAIMLRDKAKNNGCNEKIYWDYNDILEFAKKQNALISLHAGKKTQGLDQEITNALPVNQAIKKEYAEKVHIFEIGKVEDVKEYKKNVFPIIKMKKPLVFCSDNHDARLYTPTQYLWIKSEPTFNGLKQILFEPEERVCISQIKPEMKPDYLVIDRIEFKNSDFQIEPIYFSDKLTCIIGGKSTGKSILLHNIAQTLDPSQVEKKEKDTSKIRTRSDVSMTIYWADGKDGNDNSKQNPKIIYIPQTYLNQLCDEDISEKTEIDDIIRDIVLLNADARMMFDAIENEIDEYKPKLQKKIVDLRNTHQAINNKIEMMKELGDKIGIENEIKKLTSEKNNLTKVSSLTEEESELYSNAIFQIPELERSIINLDKIINKMLGITTLISPQNLDSWFSGKIKEEIESIQKMVIMKADEIWKNEKVNLMNKIKDTKDEKNRELMEFRKTESSLKNKIQENKAISELTEKIKFENEKLAAFVRHELEKQEKVREKEILIKEVVASMEFYKIKHMEFAETINNNGDLKTPDLQFSVKVPFKCDSFIKKLKEIMDTGKIAFKTIISPDTFSEENYTYEKISEILDKILSGALILKKGNTPETAIRDVLGDWYEVKYKVSMDDDSLDTMSPGKKALVLLKLLIELAESTCPILVDQPEDDLDNRSIFGELIPFIKKKKKDRQIIVVTHNANIVLGADAEQIIVANQQGKNARNKVNRFEYRSGAIENDTPLKDANGIVLNGVLNEQGIQQHICDILEGGQKAFELRRQKYHI